MSLTVAVWINCDDCGRAFGVDELHEGTVKSLKASARYNGWSLGKIDRCPECKKSAKENKTK